MKLVVAGGGTGGHVYPGMVVITLLRTAATSGDSVPPLTAERVLWIGSRNGIEEAMVRNAGIEFVGLAGGGVRGVGPWRAVQSLAQIAGSVAAARRILARFGPDAMLATGGYASVSAILAARSERVPVVIYLPDVVPGLAIRHLRRFAQRVAVTTEESYRYLGHERVVVTGYPVREEIWSLGKDEARQRMAVDQELPVLLVFGGSRGARSINQALVAGMRDLLPLCQIVHVTGRADADWVASAANQLPDELRGRYHLHPYLNDMPAALVAADLAVARAGAATLGEFPAAALPAILVPYPHAGQHQQANADYMARQGAAVVLPDAELHRLVPTILTLLQDVATLAAMRRATQAMARRDAARQLAEVLWSVARRGATGQKEG